MKGLPLVWGVVAGVVAIVALAPATGEALGRLAVARSERAVARAARPAAVVPRGLAMAAPDRETAAARLGALLRAEAVRRGVLVEQIAVVSGSDGLARVRLRVSGSEDGVAAFADAVERGAPLVRFASWRVDGVGGGAVRLAGEAVAPWR